MKIKMIEQNYPSQLEKEINNFLMNSNIEIIKIETITVFKGERYMPGYLTTITYADKVISGKAYIDKLGYQQVDKE